MRVRHICICVKIFYIFQLLSRPPVFLPAPSPVLRISQSRLQPFPQPFLKFRRFVVQRRSSLLKEFNLPAFTAEHNGIHTDRRQKRDSIGGKFMRRSGRKMRPASQVPGRHRREERLLYDGTYQRWRVRRAGRSCRSSGRRSSLRRSVPLPAAYDTDVRHGTGYIR